MKKLHLVAVVSTTLLVLAVGVVGYKKWWLTRPSASNFDAAIKLIWDKKHSKFGGRYNRDDQNSVCISLPPSFEADSRSGNYRAFAWYIDYVQDSPSAGPRENQLRKLDALAKVGLLNKTNEIADVKGEFKEVSRYRLSDKGWAAASYGDNSTCFNYGKMTYWGVKNFSPLSGDNAQGIDVYSVNIMTGIPENPGLVDWARDPVILSAFPEVSESLKGKVVPIILAKGSGAWGEYNSDRENRFLDRSGTDEVPPEFKKKIDEQASLPPPSPEEIKRLLQGEDWLGQSDYSRTNCINLPNGDKFPVDRSYSQRMPSQYSVAIFTDKQRASYDRVVKKTIPYLESLEQAGVLKSRTTMLSASGKIGGDDLQSAKLYELADAYADKLSTNNVACLSLGKPEIQFVDIKINNVDEEGNPFSSFQFKIRLKYKNAPDWMKDPVLKKAWQELGNAVDYGKACQGQYSFDRKTRAKTSGGASCWWAFNSMEDKL